MILKDFFKKYGWLYIPGVLLLAANAYLQTFPAKILGDVIDEMHAVSISQNAVFLGIRNMVFAGISIFLTRLGWRYLIIGNSRNMENYIRLRLFQQYQLLGVNFYNQNHTGDLIAYGINDINAIRMMFGPGLALSISGLGTGIVSISRMFGDIHPRLAAFALAPVPILILANLFLGKALRVRFRKVQEIFAAVSGRVNENINGIRVIKAYVQEQKEVERFEQLNQKSWDINMDMVRLSSVRGPMVTLIFGISFTICLLYGSSLVRQGAITLGDFIAFNGYLTLIIRPVMSIVRISNVLQRGMASYRRVDDIMKEKPSVIDPPVSSVEKITGDVEVKNLTFTYPGKTIPALKNVSFHLHPGQTLGILGRTGSGKTTLANILVRLFEAPEGSVLFDGKDISTITLDVLRSGIGYAPQDNYLFSTSIDENIRFFGTEFTRDQVETAAREAAVYESVTEFPEGFDTVVGGRGATLSGGQKQRVGLARALVKHPRLLILDDALSAVDTKTEKTIQENLKTHCRDGASVVLISHRISALKDCDQILVLENGSVTETGTHEELLRTGGLYATIAQEQAHGDAVAEEA